MSPNGVLLALGTNESYHRGSSNGAPYVPPPEQRVTLEPEQRVTAQPTMLSDLAHNRCPPHHVGTQSYNTLGPQIMKAHTLGQTQNKIPGSIPLITNAVHQCHVPIPPPPLYLQPLSLLVGKTGQNFAEFCDYSNSRPFHTWIFIRILLFRSYNFFSLIQNTFLPVWNTFPPLVFQFSCIRKPSCSFFFCPP